MGNCQSDPDAQKSKAVENELKSHKNAEAMTIKILLLGAGESGKSTIFKQMQLLHCDGYTNDERIAFRSTVHQNTIQNIQDLVRGGVKLGFLAAKPGEDDPSRVASEHFPEVMALEDTAPLTNAVAELIKKAWEDENLQEAYQRRNEFILNDSTSYFFDELSRLADPDYVPSNQDILRTRVRTSGIVEMSWMASGTEFKLFDVGGQRNERRKWIHCFDNVQAVLFVAAISEYDQGLYEDDTSNRLEEALSLFSEICNSRFFVTSSMILFLNKKDLFQEKIQRKPLNTFFPDYKGTTLQEAHDYVREQFSSRNNVKDKQLYVHFTTATDTSNIAFVFEAVKDNILTQNLKGSGFM